MLPSHHLLICTGMTCAQEGAEEMLLSLKKNLQQQNLHKKIRITLCRCLGQCGTGPNMVIYPDGTWYGQVGESEILKIIKEHLIKGTVVQELIQIPIDEP